MKTEKLNSLIHKVDTVKKSLEEIKRVLEDELSATSIREEHVRRSLTESSHVNDEELTRAYLELRQRFAEVGPRSVEEFAAQRTGTYLDRFVRVNNIPIPVKRAKSETVEALANYLASSTLIRGI